MLKRVNLDKHGYSQGQFRNLRCNRGVKGKLRHLGDERKSWKNELWNGGFIVDFGCVLVTCETRNWYVSPVQLLSLLWLRVCVAGWGLSMAKVKGLASSLATTSSPIAVQGNMVVTESGGVDLWLENSQADITAKRKKEEDRRNVCNTAEADWEN